jgi:hypothetical protein
MRASKIEQATMTYFGPHVGAMSRLIQVGAASRRRDSSLQLSGLRSVAWLDACLVGTPLPTISLEWVGDGDGACSSLSLKSSCRNALSYFLCTFVVPFPVPTVLLLAVQREPPLEKGVVATRTFEFELELSPATALPSSSHCTPLLQSDG